MLEPGRGAMRALRALVFLAVATSLTLAGHVAGGGMVHPLGVAALAVLTWPVALLGSGRQRGVRHLFPTLAGGQLAGHAVLAHVGTAVAGASGGSGCTTASVHHGHLLLDCSGSVATTGGQVSLSTMTVAHLGAALVLSFVLARGETALWRVVDLAVPVLPRLAPPAVEGSGAVTFLLRGWVRDLDVAVVPGRGPPVPA